RRLTECFGALVDGRCSVTADRLAPPRAQGCVRRGRWWVGIAARVGADAGAGRRGIGGRAPDSARRPHHGTSAYRRGLAPVGRCGRGWLVRSGGRRGRLGLTARRLQGATVARPPGWWAWRRG